MLLSKSSLVPIAFLLISPLLRGAAPRPSVDLRECLRPSPIRLVDEGDLTITGSSSLADGTTIVIRTTRSTGEVFQISRRIAGGKFSCRYPSDFPGAPALKPCVLYVDAISGPDLLSQQAEASFIIRGGTKSGWPDLPSSFTDDFIDARGAKDSQAVTWGVHRTLVNRFMQSRGAKMARAGRMPFDLANAADFEWFKKSITIYDFDHRDRDWSSSLNHRPARTFWQAEWNRWFGPGNDHPWDGDASNRKPENYRPYTFSNDLADLLVLHQMRRGAPASLQDNRNALCDEALSNLLALQYRGPGSFPLSEQGKPAKNYTAGAFRYGFFETGEWLTEGTGWFVNAEAGDHRGGGVFNGRSLWALGESLKADPAGPRAKELREAIGLTLRYCLYDALKDRHTKLVGAGLPFWRQAGEHGYLTLGMLAALHADPQMKVTLDPSKPDRPLADITADALNALVAAINPDGHWTKYPDQDAMGLAALAEGAMLLSSHPDASLWKRTAIAAADGWLSAKPDPSERTLPSPHFGRREGRRMTFLVANDPQVHINLYISGLWLHALADAYSLTREDRYRARAEGILAYLCGDNPFHARLLNELGAVYNIARDTGGEDSRLNWDCYPESTAFVQIGLLHWLDATTSRTSP